MAAGHNRSVRQAPSEAETGAKNASFGQDPFYAELLYQIAWTHDVMGLESAAVPFYEQSLSAGLAEKWRPGALLGLGSTYRTLGQYEQSENVLRRAIEDYPQHRQFQVFYAMTLYNLRQNDKAMGVLLHLLADTSGDPGISEYARAISYYADKLDQVW
ncbi:tetratricopeptide repeat protein [Paenibacillus zanthoxyli]|uniref:tetratricopeptide repeat protein n=1 Tax=Paenibacillus zanthoxyli TaxID=369399 RepID=UPI001E44BC06|nr:tetratricopeptide repeat protein [Paenibacillus zanthoxyli]